MISPVFQNLNKIDSIIKEFYEVGFIFKESLDHYKFIVKDKSLKMNVIIDRDSFPTHLLSHNEKFNWEYLSDPSNKRSRIRRVSTLSTIKEDIKSIFDNKMFNNSYLSSINNEMITESVDTKVKTIRREEEGSIIINKELLEELFDKHSIKTNFNIREVKSNGFTGNDFYNNIESYEIYSDLESREYNGVIKPSTMINIEQELSSLFDEVIFNTHSYKVTLEIEVIKQEVILE